MMSIGKSPVRECDPELYALIAAEQERQQQCIELIASENFTSYAVMDCLGSCLTNKYSEGYPGSRYYGGNEHIDKIERLCIKRVLNAFSLDENEFGVNVQPYSGSPANFAVYTAFLQPQSRFMGLDLPDGGHLTHGFYMGKKKVSATSKFFQTLPYKLDPQTGLIDYDGLEKDAKKFCPELIVAGVSAHSRLLDYARLRNICDSVGALLFCDIAHVAGLIASKQIESPFPYADIVSSTVHKTLRGPRSGIIIFRKIGIDGKPTDYETKINAAVFPGLQGGPHNHQIAAIATQMLEVSTPAFAEYSKNVIKNAKVLANELMMRDFSVISGGTDIHMFVVDLVNFGISGSKMQLLCDECNITLNKNTTPKDTSPLNPGGIRLGTAAMTSRGATEEDMVEIADFLFQVATVGGEIQNEYGRPLVDFKKGLNNCKLSEISQKVKKFTKKFNFPGRLI